MGTADMIGLFFFMIPIYIIYKHVMTKQQAQQQLDMLKQSGFQVDHLLDGTVKVAFNDSAKKVAFVFRDAAIQYDYADITHWQWKWVERNARKISNGLHFTLRDKNRPLVKVDGLSENQAEHWTAKLEAILNG